VREHRLEDKIVTISGASGTLTFPANFMLIAAPPKYGGTQPAMNPCPCSYLGDPVKECTCSQMMITRYRSASLRGFPCLTDGRTAPSVTSASSRFAQDMAPAR